MAWGGKRKGAGRKPNAAKAILKKTIEEAGEDAKAALGLLVAFFEDASLDPRLRRDCAKDVMERVWGKPTERYETKATVAVEHDFTDDAAANLLSILAGLGAIQPRAEKGGDAKAQ